MDLLPIVYVAGAYSADNVTLVLRNIREGVKLAEKVFATGLAAPFCPWLDWMYEVFGDHDVQRYYDYSFAFLARADVLLIRRTGAKESNGTQSEIEYAKRYGIPIFYDDEWTEFTLWLKSHYSKKEAT